MTFTIVTHVVHIKKGNSYYGYSPYVNEMNIWLKYVTEVIIVAPIINGNLTALHTSYNHNNIKFIPLESFNFLTIKSCLNAIYQLPFNFFKICYQLNQSNHIHLRCPGNIGLVACLAQLFFPKIVKTVKYAGNWDINSKQPASYQLQKFILNSKFLTRNCKVLVYGKWEKSSSNIVPFFTATYQNSEIESTEIRKFEIPLKFIFVGTLSSGKNPEYAIKIVKEINERGFPATLELYGEGIEKEKLQIFIKNHHIEKYISFKGNQSKEVVKKAYQQSHFVILPSKSEGWPKALAEGMFWGCLPIATKISCVPYMLGYENRGVLLDLEITSDSKKILLLINNESQYNEMATNAMQWSRNYTLDYFELEIIKLLQ